MIRDPKAIIYSDSDGVICDFMAGAVAMVGPSAFAGHVDWPTKQAQGQIINQNKTFWETLPPMHDWRVYWSYIEGYMPHILTAVPSWEHNFNEVEDGKREWYRRHIPSLSAGRIHIVYREEKAKFAMHGPTHNILIDDHLKNIQEFEAAGGIGIHHVSARVTILKLKELGYH